jgi:YegS/Rv2252/BmrU family lipid kinase
LDKDLAFDYDIHMGNRKTLIILNPAANKGKASARAAGIADRLKAAGISHDFAMTEGSGHAWRLAASAEKGGYDAVVAAGGDGTANEVVNGLMEASSGAPTKVAMGLLPIGRGNDFACGADVPADFEAALELLVAGKRRPMDVGLIKGGDYPQGRYFCNGVGIGFDTIVGLEAAKLKWARGALGYIVGALKTFIAFPEPPEVTFSYDGTSFPCRPGIINIMNGRRLGGLFWMAPDGKNYDGLFDFCLSTDKVGRMEMGSIILRYVKGTQAGHPRIKTGQGRVFRIEAPGGGLVVHADGETICVDGKGLSLECLPARIPMICAVPGEG